MEKDRKKLSLRIIIRFIAAISAFLAVFCLTLPSARKKNALSAAGNAVLEAMTPVSTAISYYSADKIEALAQSPALNSDCKYIAGLLAQLNTQQGYERMYILSRLDDKKLCYLIDGSYRDNGKSGTDYFAPAAEYPTENGYKAVKQLADKLYSNKLTGGFANEIVTNQNRKNVVVSCLPIYSAGHSVAAVLCIEADPGNTAFNMIGGIDLYKVGWFFAAVVLLCMAFIVFRKKFAAWRENRRAEKTGGRENAILIEEGDITEEQDFARDDSSESDLPTADEDIPTEETK